MSKTRIKPLTFAVDVATVLKSADQAALNKEAAKVLVALEEARDTMLRPVFPPQLMTRQSECRVRSAVARKS